MLNFQNLISKKVEVRYQCVMKRYCHDYDNRNYRVRNLEDSWILSRPNIASLLEEILRHIIDHSIAYNVSIKACIDKLNDEDDAAKLAKIKTSIDLLLKTNIPDSLFYTLTGNDYFLDTEALDTETITSTLSTCFNQRDTQYSLTFSPIVIMCVPLNDACDPVPIVSEADIQPMVSELRCRLADIATAADMKVEKIVNARLEEQQQRQDKERDIEYAKFLELKKKFEP